MIKGSSLPEREAVERFGLGEALQRYKYGSREPAPDAWVRVVEGDCRIAGDLELDWESFDHYALIVDGNLEVDGSVILTWNLSGPFLFVTGNLRARNLLAGDGEIRICGDADIQELLLGIGNDGHLSIDGTTRAGFILQDDHSMWITSSAVCWRAHDWPAGMPLSEYLHHEIPVERNEYGIESAETELLIARVRTGQPMLRAADDPRPRRTYEQWLEVCSDFGRALEYVPRELVDEPMCRAAVSAWGPAVKYAPRELVTGELCDLALAEDPGALGAIPEEFRTPERCRIAVEHDGDLLSDVPLHLRTVELCMRALETGKSIQTASYVPKDVFTPELALHAVKLYWGWLRHVPEHLRTREVCVAAVSVNPLILDEVPEPLFQELKKRYLRGHWKEAWARKL
jgi:hypothetical protein